MYFLNRSVFRCWNLFPLLILPYAEFPVSGQEDQAGVIAALCCSTPARVALGGR